MGDSFQIEFQCWEYSDRSLNVNFDYDRDELLVNIHSV